MNSDNEVFRSIYMSYRPVLLMVAAKKNIPVDDRDDIVQDTFVKFFKYYNPEWNENQVKGMLVKFLNWCYVDSLRRQSCRPVTYVDPARMESGEILAVATEKHNPQNMILKAEENQDVVDALNKMTPELSEAIVKLVIQERPVGEVSEELGISEGTCRTRLSRGRSRMREIVYGESSRTSKLDGKKRGEKSLTAPKDKKQTGVKKFCEKDETTARPPDSAELPGST